MRGDDAICGRLFSYIDLEKRIREDHPLRVIRAIANVALKSLSGEFEKLYSPLGRESIPPERLLRALLLQAFYSIRSERQLVERIDHDLLFRWFVGLGIEDPVWDATTFTKNRDRLLEGDVAAQFLAAGECRPSGSQNAPKSTFFQHPVSLTESQNSRSCISVVNNRKMWYL